MTKATSPATKKRKSPVKKTNVEKAADDSDSVLSAVDEKVIASPTKKQRKSPVKKTKTAAAGPTAGSPGSAKSAEAAADGEDKETEVKDEANADA